MLAQKIIIQYGTNIGIKIFGMFAGIVVARIAGPQVLGTLSYGLAYVSMFSIITGIFGTPHVKLVSEGKPHGKCIGTYSVLQFSSIGLFLLLTILWFLFQKYSLGHKFESDAVEIVVFIFIFKITLDKILIFSEDVFLAKLQQVKSNLPKIAMELVYHPGRIIIVLLGFKAVALASWELVVSILVLPIIYKLLKQLEWDKFDRALVKDYIKYALPILLYMIFGIVSSKGDKLILQHYSNTAELGYYTAAYSVGGLVLILGGTIGQIFFPLFSSYIANNDWDSLNDKISKYHKFITIFILPFICILSLLSEPFITILLSSKYLPSAAPFAILIISSFFMIWFIPYGNVISGKGKFYLYAFITFLKFLVFVVSIIFFISPDFLGLGARGLAYNTLLVVIAEGIFYYFAAFKIGVMKFYKNNFYSLTIVLIITGLFYLIIPEITALTSIWWVILIISYLTAVYLILFITNHISKEYFRTSLNFFDPKLFIKYIKEEISTKKQDTNDKKF